MAARIFKTKHSAPPKGVTLEDEPEADKALRMLRGLREFVASKKVGVMAMQLDGQTIMLIKYNPEVHNPDADYRPSATL